MDMGAPLHVINTSSSLWTVTPSLVKMEIFPLSLVLPTLIKDVGILLSESALAVSLDVCGRESLVSHFTLFVPALATPTRFVDRQIIGIPVFNLSPLLT